MKRVWAVLVIALVGCAKRPAPPPPLYPPDSEYEWDFDDLESSDTVTDIASVYEAHLKQIGVSVER